MEVVVDDGLLKVDISSLETCTQQNTFWLFRECEDAIQVKLNYNDKFIEENSFILFSKWYNKRYINNPLPPLPKSNKRSYSTSHRIEIAYKTMWRCAMCDYLLTPDFAIDHIVELRYGGKDDWENTCALCQKCHGKKTRANTLKKHVAFAKEFGRRAQEIEDNIFEKLKCKRSKYF